MLEPEQPRVLGKYELIKKLEEEGVLGQERCPEQYYWHWPVRNLDALPVELLPDYEIYGEIRLY